MTKPFRFGEDHQLDPNMLVRRALLNLRLSAYQVSSGDERFFRLNGAARASFYATAEATMNDIFQRVEKAHQNQSAAIQPGPAQCAVCGGVALRPAWHGLLWGCKTHIQEVDSKGPFHQFQD